MKIKRKSIFVIAFFLSLGSIFGLTSYLLSYFASDTSETKNSSFVRRETQNSQDKQNQDILNQEVKRINELKVEFINKTSNIVANSLNDNELNYKPKKQKFNYQIIHKTITVDGIYDITIKITYKNESENALRKVSISGLNKKIINSGNAQDLADVQAEVTRIQTNFANVNISSTNKIGANSLTDTELNFQEQAGFTYSITHSDIANDGTYDVTINVAKGNANQDATLKATVTGIDQAIVDAEVARVENELNGQAITTSKTSIGANGLEPDLNYQNPNNLFDYVVTHDPLNSDGDIQVSVKVSLKANSQATGSASPTVTVTGIDQANTNAQNAKDLADVQAEVTRIQTNFANVNISSTNKIGANSLTDTELNFQEKAGFACSITHSDIANDGTYDLTINVSKGNANQNANIQVTIRGITKIQRPIDFNSWNRVQNSSNINNGAGGVIFEDSKGNLWSMGYNSPLQVLKNGQSTWQPASSNSNIDNGYGGKIYEDSKGNLWLLASGIPLQVLDLNDPKAQWKDAGNNSKINDGVEGSILEDGEGNLWAMGKDAPLQVLRRNSTRWEDAGQNSNITNGWRGAIFEDSQGNLWTNGHRSLPQVLKKGASSWENVKNYYKTSSSITFIEKNNGKVEIISRPALKDSQGNIWSIRANRFQNNDFSLQKLSKGSPHWQWAGLNSKVNSSGYGTIFEDSKGNIWVYSANAPLQFLKKGTNSWQDIDLFKSFYRNDYANNGGYGTIYEDSKGNLWFMGDSIPLHVLNLNQ